MSKLTSYGPDLFSVHLLCFSFSHSLFSIPVSVPYILFFVQFSVTVQWDPVAAIIALQNSVKLTL